MNTFLKPFASLVPLLCALLLSACASSGRSRVASSREAGRYSHRMHNRFYEAWGAAALSPGAAREISVPVDVQIDGTGSVRRFHIAKPSGYAALDKSIGDVGRRVTRVAPPPVASSRDRFDLRIFFELDVKR